MKRNRWLDIAKGFFICSIVFSHSGNNTLHHYLFWFHVPAFFMIAGFLFKRIDNQHDLNIWTAKKIRRLLIPYVSFGLLILIVIQMQDYNLNEIPIYIQNLFIGGQFIGYHYGIFWFVTAFLITQILFAYLTTYIKSDVIIITIAAASYILAHIYSLSQPTIKIPWSIDTVLITFPYMVLGYYSKNIIDKIKMSYSVIAVFIIGIVVLLDRYNFIRYDLDLKVNLYNHLALDLIVPISCVVIILFISKKVENSYIGTVFEQFGKSSMSIMYTHVSIMIILKQHIELNVVLIATMSLLISFVIHILMKQFKITEFLFFGNINKKVKYEKQTRSA